MRFSFRSPLIAFYWLPILILWAPSLGRGSSCRRASENLKDRFTFSVSKAGDPKLFASDTGWSENRFGHAYVTMSLDAENDVVVNRPLLDAYEHATGIHVTLDLHLELIDFLKRNNIDPSEAIVIASGVHGVLVWHPKLGNQVMKILSPTFSHTEFLAREQYRTRLGNSQFQLTSLWQAYVRAEDTRPDWPKAIVDEYQAHVRLAYRSQASHALHRAYQLILPGLMAAQAQSQFFDFAQVTFIGNGFFLREYYPDSQLDFLEIENLSAAPSLEATLDLLIRYDEPSPPLARMFGHLVFAVPSFFFSPTLYEKTRKTARPRLFVIFDLD